MLFDIRSNEETKKYLNTIFPHYPLKRLDVSEHIVVRSEMYTHSEVNTIHCTDWIWNKNINKTLLFPLKYFQN